MKRIRAESFDLVIDGTMTGSAALLTRWAGGKVRIGAGPEKRQFAYTTMVPEPPRRLWRVEAMRQYYGSMGLSVPPDACMRIALSDAERERAAGRWQHMGWSDETWVTGVFIGARGQKRWTLEGWAEVINTLWREREDDEGLVVFHGAEEVDMVEKLEPLIPAEIPLSFSPGIRNFAALVAKCRQFVTTDTGPMHLACALGVPVVSLFARKAWPRFAPQREFDVPVHNPDKPTAREVIEAHRKQRAMLRT
jgi:ADP-heptose:LPS heptosyltransferase